MSETFVIGDVVKVKSGGPKMTVNEVGEFNGKPTVWCVWFEKDDRKENSFHPGTLERA